MVLALRSVLVLLLHDCRSTSTLRRIYCLQALILRKWDEHKIGEVLV